MGWGSLGEEARGPDGWMPGHQSMDRYCDAKLQVRALAGVCGYRIKTEEGRCCDCICIIVLIVPPSSPLRFILVVTQWEMYYGRGELSPDKSRGAVVPQAVYI